MRTLVNRISPSFNYNKGLQWGKLIALTGGGQILVQVFGFTSGILIIRLLSTQEYALYTLANTMLGTMVMLADNGISNGVMAEAGKVWQDKNQLGLVLSTGLSLRKKFALYTLVITLPILVYLLATHNASWLSICLISLSTILAFLSTLSDTLLEIVPKLHQDIKSLQQNQIEVNVIRLILSALLVFIFPITFIALLANGLPRIYGNYKLKKIAFYFAEEKKSVDLKVEAKIMRGVRRTLPIVIYHCISGQLSIWLISIFGATTSIAQIGALSRVSVLFTLFSGIFSTLIVPRFSRMPFVKTLLIKQFTLIQLSTFAASLIILAFIILLNNQILWVLGKNYHNLHYELLLISIAGCIGLMEGICSQLILSRGWFFNPYILISVNIISTLVFILFINPSSLASILKFNISMSIISYAMGLVFGTKKILYENFN